jgi:hypothetical protein
VGLFFNPSHHTGRIYSYKRKYGSHKRKTAAEREGKDSAHRQDITDHSNLLKKIRKLMLTLQLQVLTSQTECYEPSLLNCDDFGTEIPVVVQQETA